jgi:hypothetical protein
MVKGMVKGRFGPEKTKRRGAGRARGSGRGFAVRGWVVPRLACVFGMARPIDFAHAGGERRARNGSRWPVHEAELMEDRALARSPINFAYPTWNVVSRVVTFLECNAIIFFYGWKQATFLPTRDVV